MANIEKKIWPKYFSKALSREKNTELRLADFKIKKGDTLILKEWNPKSKAYTGRILRKKVANVNRVTDLFKFHSVRDFKKYGLYLIEMK